MAGITEESEKAIARDNNCDHHIQPSASLLHHDACQELWTLHCDNREIDLVSSKYEACRPSLLFRNANSVINIPILEKSGEVNRISSSNVAISQRNEDNRDEVSPLSLSPTNLDGVSKFHDPFNFNHSFITTDNNVGNASRKYSSTSRNSISSMHIKNDIDNRKKRSRVPSISDAISLQSWSDLSMDKALTNSDVYIRKDSASNCSSVSCHPVKHKEKNQNQGAASKIVDNHPSSSPPSTKASHKKVSHKIDGSAKNPFTNWMKSINSPSKSNSKSQSKNRGSARSTQQHRYTDSAYNDDGDDFLNPDKMKTKFLSVWNNVKYGWTVKLKTNFDDDAPLFLLGRCYHKKIDESQTHDSRISSLDQFRQDFSSRIWFTYRREFPQLMGSSLTTDCGWGCMLRSGQMMLAQALVLHFLGREWRWYNFQDVHHNALHQQIIRWFGDIPSNQHPFSVHRLVQFGEKYLDKKPGDWYGPASVAHIMREAMDHAYDLNPLLEMCVYVAYDCTVYIQDVIDCCTSHPRSSSVNCDSSELESLSSSSKEEYWRPVILLIPIRLGGEKLNTIYKPCVRSLFSQDNCLGIIGGRPKHSLYFIGFQDDKLIHLDPHYCQDVVDMKKRDFPVHSFHCLSPRKMAISRMDPSCTVGFYCKTRLDFFNFVDQTKELVTPPMQRTPYPMFIFVDGHNTQSGFDHVCQEEEHYLRISHIDSDRNTRKQSTRKQSTASEDYVFL